MAENTNHMKLGVSYNKILEKQTYFIPGALSTRSQRHLVKSENKTLLAAKAL